MGKLVSCKTCKGKVDNTAKSCPHCGVAKPADKPMSRDSQGCLIIVMFIAVLITWGVTSQKKWHRDEPTTPLTRGQEITQSFNAFTGEHKEVKKWLMSVLKNPDSYKHIDTSYIDKGTYLLVKMQYFATNSFGGVDRFSVTAKTLPTGKVIEIVNNR